MANTSIGGLVSGLDTATIISQLMQLEAQPQTRLKTKVTVGAERTHRSAGAQHQAQQPWPPRPADLRRTAGWAAQRRHAAAART